MVLNWVMFSDFSFFGINQPSACCQHGGNFPCFFWKTLVRIWIRFVCLTPHPWYYVCNASSDLLFTTHLMRLGIGRSLHGSLEHEGLLNISSKIYTRLSLLTLNWCPSYLNHPLQTVWMCLMTLRPAFVPLLKRKVFVRPGTFLTRHISKLRTNA